MKISITAEGHNDPVEEFQTLEEVISFLRERPVGLIGLPSSEVEKKIEADRSLHIRKTRALEELISVIPLGWKSVSDSSGRFTATLHE